MRKNEAKSTKKTKNHIDIAGIESKWQSVWEKERVYQPNLETAKRPFFNLMMFPYPSAEGLHVGNFYAFTGADVYGRYQRMLGRDVFEPIGLDGFGIHSENYALKVGRTPQEHASISEKNFYRQLRSIGNGFAWENKVETYDPEYYKWTQWLFIQLFKKGLAYRKKSPVNFCPSCKTVLADEQVIDGKCERCSSVVGKKDLEQWFFRITSYADRLNENIEGLNWSEKVKLAQKNWIGKKTGINIKYNLDNFRFPPGSNFLFLHAYNDTSADVFWPWLKRELESRGAKVQSPDLPGGSNPDINAQVEFILKNMSINENTTIVTHSLGGVASLKLLPRIKHKIKKLVLIAPPLNPSFKDGVERPGVEASNDWIFDFASVKQKAKDIVVLEDKNDHIIPQSHTREIASRLNARLVVSKPDQPHFNSVEARQVLSELIPVIEVFTTRPDTNFGATFIALAPEHSLVSAMLSNEIKVDPKIWQEITGYLENAKNKTEIERQAEGKEKTGVFTGLYAVNELTGYKMPVWIADFVLSGFGTGALVGVPGHDKRDFEFAHKFGIEIIRVVVGKDSDSSPIERIEQVQEEEGTMINSGFLDGMEIRKAGEKIMDYMEQKGYGCRQTTFRLRDWLISRQRYWGPPIPLVNCASCGWQPVPEEDLPVLLPKLDDWKPTGTGKGPLAKLEDWINTKCPGCGGDARRESDVSDSFLDSSWYFLRYLASGWNDLPFPSAELAKRKKQNAKSKNEIENWKLKTENSGKRIAFLPVAMYIGGAEHSVLHLLYSRFITMALKDMGHIEIEEPYARFYAHGLIIKDGAKMSKSKGNIVVPDLYISKYGADTLRAYLMFLGPFNQGGDFRDSGIEGMYRFLRRVHFLLTNLPLANTSPDPERKKQMHTAIKGITDDLDALRFNTAISKLMIWYNFLSKQNSLTNEEILNYLKLLAPFAPHMAEELYQRFFVKENGAKFISIHTEFWPEFDLRHLEEDSVTIAIQVNGKVRSTINFQKKRVNDKEEILKLALNDEKIKGFIQNKTILKQIYVPGKIVNLVIK